MTGAVHPAERLWVNGEPVAPKDIRVGDTIESAGARRARVEKVTQGSGRGTIWLYGASGAQIRCLKDQRVQISVAGRTRYRTAEKIKPGDFLLGLVSGRVCVDPVVAIRTMEESVPAVYLEVPAISLVSEEGILCRPA
jgi:hypothetical protein